MQRGAFARWRHTHRFVEQRGGTLAVDEVDFASPLGLLGKLVDRLLLRRYMTCFLLRHNSRFRREAERRAGHSSG
jgi:ligand-binding SRPBCC domain-containing protein